MIHLRLRKKSKLKFSNLRQLMKGKPRFQKFGDELEVNVEPGTRFERGDLTLSELGAIINWGLAETLIRSEADLPLNAGVTTLYAVTITRDDDEDVEIPANTYIAPSEHKTAKKILAAGGILVLEPNVLVNP